MKFVNDLLHAVNDGIDYFRSNSWHLFLLIVALYVLKGQAVKLKSSFAGQKLSKGGTGTDKATNRDEERHRIREQQQDILNERAKIAAQERKKKDEEERHRKNVGGKKQAKENNPSSSSSKPAGYNPMQPWSSSSGGGGYKPERRNVNARGGG